MNRTLTAMRSGQAIPRAAGSAVLLVALTIFLSIFAPASAGRLKFVGDRDKFFVKRFDKFSSSQANWYVETYATLVKKGVSCYVYLADGTEVADETLDAVMKGFDTRVVPNIEEVFGPALRPGMDGDDRVSILLAPIKDAYDGLTVFDTVRTYFDYRDLKLTEQYAFSNTRDLIVADPSKYEPGSDSFMFGLCREYQKMVRWYWKTWIAGNTPRVQEVLDPLIEDKDYWVNEGLSELAGYIAGYGHSPTLAYFEVLPKTTLAQTYPAYYFDNNRGAAYLAMLYLYEKFGKELITEIEKNQSVGLDSIQDALRTRRTGQTFSDIFPRWAVANFLDDIDLAGGIFGYRSANVNLAATISVNEFPVLDQEITVYDQEFEYIQVTSGDAGQVLFNFYGDAGNDFRIFSIKLSNLRDPVVESIPLTANIGHIDYDRFGMEYDSVVVVVTNVATYGRGKARFSMIKRGPKIAAFANPALPGNIVVNVLARSDAEIYLLQHGMEEEVPVKVRVQKETFARRVIDSGIVTLAAGNRMEDSLKDWADNSLSTGSVRIVSGKGADQEREILMNGPHHIILEEGWATPPDATSKYEISSSVRVEALYTGSFFVDRNYPGTAKLMIRGKGADGVDGATAYTFNVIPVFGPDESKVRLTFMNVVMEQAALGLSGSARTGVAVILPQDPLPVTGGTMAGGAFDIAGETGTSIVVSRQMAVGDEAPASGETLSSKVTWPAVSAASTRPVGGKTRFVVCRQEGSDWIPVPSAVEGEEITFRGAAGSRYAVVADTEGPVVSSSEAGDSLLVLDPLSGIDPDSLDLTVAGEKVPLIKEEREDGSWEVTAGGGLAMVGSRLRWTAEGSGVFSGETEGTLSASDRAGNRLSMKVSTRAVPSQALSLLCYPVPAETSMTLSVAVPGTVTTGWVGIYDFSGTLIFRASHDDIGIVGGTGSLLWDLRDRRGREVANGTYLARAVFEGSFGKSDITRKIAVLR